MITIIMAKFIVVMVAAIAAFSSGAFSWTGAALVIEEVGVNSTYNHPSGQGRIRIISERRPSIPRPSRAGACGCRNSVLPTVVRTAPPPHCW